MSELIVISLLGKSSILENRVFPPIEFSQDKNCTFGLVELLTFNSITNFENKKFYVTGIEPINIPTGSYEIEDVEKYLTERLQQSNKPRAPVQQHRVYRKPDWVYYTFRSY